jgi:hypothetical protein
MLSSALAILLFFISADIVVEGDDCWLGTHCSRNMDNCSNCGSGQVFCCQCNGAWENYWCSDQYFSVDEPTKIELLRDQVESLMKHASDDDDVVPERDAALMMGDDGKPLCASRLDVGGLSTSTIDMLASGERFGGFWDYCPRICDALFKAVGKVGSRWACFETVPEQTAACSVFVELGPEAIAACEASVFAGCQWAVGKFGSFDSGVCKSHICGSDSASAMAESYLRDEIEDLKEEIGLLRKSKN